MNMLLAGDLPALEILRAQAENAVVVKREWTGVGSFTDFAVPNTALALPQKESTHIGDVSADIEELKPGAGFVLFVREGLIQMLEGYSYDEPWLAEPTTFRLSYVTDTGRGLRTCSERDLEAIAAKLGQDGATGGET